MPRFPMTRRTDAVLRACGALAAAALGLALAAPAAAQGRLEAQYEVTLAGLPIGKGAWVVDIGDDQFSSLVTGGTTGLLKMFGGGKGTGTLQGRIVGGQLQPSTYVSSVDYGKKNETIRISLAGGNVRESSIVPEPPVTPDRIPVTDAHRRNVVDPMTGSLLRVAGTGDPLGPEACRHTISIFDGRLRYDLKLEFKRMDNAATGKGYRGPVVVCAIYFSPVAGYVPDRPAIKYLVAQRGMEVWFAPIAGTRVLAPYRFMVPTPIGTGLVTATEFVSVQKTAKTN